jgi:hypothetical protein
MLKRFLQILVLLCLPNLASGQALPSLHHSDGMTIDVPCATLLDAAFDGSSPQPAEDCGDERCPSHHCHSGHCTFLAPKEASQVPVPAAFDETSSTASSKLVPLHVLDGLDRPPRV